MINLLPPEERRQLGAARSNTLLLRYSIVLLFILALLGSEIGGSYIFINAERARNEETAQENAAKTSQYAATRQQAEAFTSSLSTAKQILDDQTPYTALVLALAKAIPSSTSIDTVAAGSPLLPASEKEIFEIPMPAALA